MKTLFHELKCHVKAFLEGLKFPSVKKKAREHVRVEKERIQQGKGRKTDQGKVMSASKVPEG